MLRLVKYKIRNNLMNKKELLYHLSREVFALALALAWVPVVSTHSIACTDKGKRYT